MTVMLSNCAAGRFAINSLISINQSAFVAVVKKPKQWQQWQQWRIRFPLCELISCFGGGGYCWLEGSSKTDTRVYGETLIYTDTDVGSSLCGLSACDLRVRLINASFTPKMTCFVCAHEPHTCAGRRGSFSRQWQRWRRDGVSGWPQGGSVQSIFRQHARARVRRVTGRLPRVYVCSKLAALIAHFATHHVPSIGAQRVYACKWLGRW